MFEIQSLKEPGTAVLIEPATLRVRRLPPRRPGLQPEDEIVYARDW